MHTLLAFSILSAITLTALSATLWLMPARATSPSSARLNILIIYACCIILPAILIAFRPSLPTDTATHLSEHAITVGIPETTPDTVQATHHIAAELSGPAARINLAVTILFLLPILISVMRIVIIRRHSRDYMIGGIKVMLHDRTGLSPFSWGNWIFIPRSVAEDPHCAMIVDHEQAHVANRHWVDLLAGRIIAALQWYNPISWIMLQRLRDIHEYQADAYVIEHGTDAYNYQMFLIEKTVGARFASLANSLNHSSLNKRITMMLSKKPRRTSRARIASAATIGVIAIGALSFSGIAQVIENATAYTAESRVENTGKVKNFSLTVGTDESSATTGCSAAGTSGSDGLNPSASGNGNDGSKIQPTFPGGDKELINFIYDNLKYPESSMKAQESGIVIVNFVVETDGKVSNAMIVRGVSEAIDKEALRVVSLLPKFTPGSLNGKAVKCTYHLPISFKIQP